MKAAEAANVKVGERVSVYAVGDQEYGTKGKIVALDDHGIALSLVGEGVQYSLDYIPWFTVTAVVWLGERNE